MPDIDRLSIRRRRKDWQVAYEMDSLGRRTGRFQLLNERGEYDLLWPGFWLGEVEMRARPLSGTDSNG